jgi:uncharacterized protein (PEP-CTERM system associated)
LGTVSAGLGVLIVNNRMLAAGVTLLAVSAGAGDAFAQVAYDPATGFLTPAQTLGQPPLGTTSTFPLFPSTGLGFAGAPATYTGAVGPAIAPVAPTSPAQAPLPNPLLPPLQPGATPVQANDDRAPALIIQPGAGLAQGFDDNPRQTPNRLADTVTNLNASLLGSIDTPHLQGVLSSTAQYLKYARATDQDALTVNGTAYGLATLLPEHLYLDGRAAMFQVSPTGGIGFTNPLLVSPVQQTSLITTSVSPILRESFGENVEADLRYNHGSITPNSAFFQGGSTGPTATTTLAAAQANRGDLTVALGHGDGVLSSRARLTADDVSSQSVAASTRFRGIDDFQYRINSQIALIARLGYENLRYPTAGLAFTGPVAEAGTRLDLAPGSSLIARYGRDHASWGFNGAVSQTLTPRTVLLASYQHGISSEQEQILSNLTTSRLDPYGTIINTDTGLPQALADPELDFSQSGVFRTQQANIALLHEFETDSLRLFAFYDKETSLLASVAGDTARGAAISWFRSMTPRLTGGVTVGYAAHTGDKTISTGISLLYNLKDGVDATLNYQFENVFASTPGASSLRNTLFVGVQASF